MGSLSSPPKAPAQPQVVYVPAPASQVPTTPSASAKQSDTEKEAKASAVRSRNLLSLNRGRFGTIATSFQGFLQERQNNAGTSSRKNLLGE